MLSCRWLRLLAGQSLGESQWDLFTGISEQRPSRWKRCSGAIKLQYCYFFYLFPLVNNILGCSFSDGSAIFKGCFHRPDNVTLALPFSTVIQNMSVDKCVDLCTEKVGLFGITRCTFRHLRRQRGFSPQLCCLFVLFLFSQEKTLAVLAGDRCHCGFPTPLFSLHEPEDEGMCLSRCRGQEFESCGSDEYFVVYQTQVQGNNMQRLKRHTQVHADNSV